MFLSLALLSPFLAHAFTVQLQPIGRVKGVQQARAVFSEPMIPFGDPRGISPFTIQCSKAGKGLWEDSRTWIYEFEGTLPAGESCSFEAVKGLRSLKKKSWEGEQKFSFSTGSPIIARSQPYDGGQIEEQQGFLLTLDGPVNLATVEKSAYFLVEGLPEKIPAKLISEKLRLEMAARGGRYEEEGGQAPVQYSVAIEPSRPLPPGKRIQLVWGKGIASANGVVAENDQLLAFSTRNAFSATFSCTRENANAPCLPLGEFTLQFSSSIAAKDAAKILLTTASGTRKAKIGEEEEFVSYLRFAGPFDPNANWKLELPKGLKDETGRTLTNADKFPLQVRTGAYPPLAKFAAPFGLLESADAVLPVTLRNVEEKLSSQRIRGQKRKIDLSNPTELIRWISLVEGRHDQYIRWENDNSIDMRGNSLLKGEKSAEKFELPKPNGKEAFEVVGIPLGEKGFHVVELESRLLGESLMGKNVPMYVAASALVTDLGVHVKWGKESSLIWVTALSSAASVSGADVRVVDCSGKTLWKGKTGKDGTVLADGLPAPHKAAQCENKNNYSFGNGLFVFAEKKGDFSFAHTSWDEGIEPWRFQVPFESEGRDSTAHTVFDRTLFRSGQTVHMKHYLRENYLRGIRFKSGASPKNLVIIHSSGQRFVQPLKLDQNGTGENEWKIPEGARLGTYTVYFVEKNVEAKAGPDEDSEDRFSVWADGVYRTGEFRLEEFRLPVLTGEIQWAPGANVAPKEVSADLTVRYLNGGAAAGLPVKMRAQAEKTGAIFFPEFEGFTFANGGVALGKSSRQANPEQNLALKPAPLTLDAGGSGRSKLTGLPSWDVPYQIQLEAEFRDPNGEMQTLSRTTKIAPAAALVGIKPDGWASSQELVKFKVAVVSPDGRPLPKRQVNVRWLERKTFSHRRRIVGGFYAYENSEETKALGIACKGESNSEGYLFCEGKAPASGSLILQAEVEEAGKPSVAHQDIWVAGKEEWWFPTENNDRIDFLSEQKQYEPGASAKFQLRMPFREAEVLVTVEREGVIDHVVKKVSGTNPVIELPIKDSYSPNVYVSALLVRGRVSDPKATAVVDLGKPSFKMGLSEIQVGWKAHELKVKVVPAGQDFKVRGKAKVRVSVSRSSDGKAASKGKVLFVAVDEALLEIRSNPSWKLLDAMMGRRSLRVHTSTAQSQVVGKRHFGLKALPSGGGGGVGSARELFDTLLFWKGEVDLDAEGQAEVEVPLNDSLSSFRLVAIATEGADRFGTGEASIRTRQDLMLFSGVSPLARQGDITSPELTVRNGGERDLVALVKASVGGNALAEKEVKLAPGASQAVRWEFAIPQNVESLRYDFSAKAGDAIDQLKITQKVVPALRESVIQGTLERLDKPIQLTLAPPKDMVAGRGQVEVKLERKLGSSLGAVEEFMRIYPHSCLEQQVSRAISLQDEKLWDGIVKSLPQYIDGQGLLKFYPGMSDGSEVLTTYVLRIADAAGYKIPEGNLPEMLTALKNFVSAKSYSAGFVYPAADVSLRKLSALETLSRYNSFDPALLETIQVDPDTMPMAGLLDWQNLLRREKAIPQREALLKKVDQSIRARIHYRGTILGFKSDTAEDLWWLMGSTDREVNRLLLAAVDDPSWKEDMGRLVRGALARQKRGVWDLTTANAWGVVAMKQFSAKFEKEKVSGASVLSSGSKREDIPWSEKGAFLSIPFEKGKQTYQVEHKGEGQPWMFLYSRAAIKLKEPLFKGYRVKRTVRPIEQKRKGRWSVGDSYRVILEIEAPADMTWVAVTDPAPAGATVLGTGLGRDSALLSQQDRQKGGWLAHEEKGFEGYRGYYQWLPKGNATLEYSVRLNSAGRFQLPNTRVEAMYSPEMYSESPNAEMVVE